MLYLVGGEGRGAQAEARAEDGERKATSQGFIIKPVTTAGDCSFIPTETVLEKCKTHALKIILPGGRGSWGISTPTPLSLLAEGCPPRGLISQREPVSKLNWTAAFSKKPSGPETQILEAGSFLEHTEAMKSEGHRQCYDSIS